MTCKSEGPDRARRAGNAYRAFEVLHSVVGNIQIYRPCISSSSAYSYRVARAFRVSCHCTCSWWQPTWSPVAVSQRTPDYVRCPRQRPLATHSAAVAMARDAGLFAEFIDSDYMTSQPRPGRRVESHNANMNTNERGNDNVQDRCCSMRLVAHANRRDVYIAQRSAAAVAIGLIWLLSQHSRQRQMSAHQASAK